MEETKTIEEEGPTTFRRFKRAPLRRFPRKTDIYVKRKRPIHSYLQRIRKLFDECKESFVIVHGLGAALLPAIEVAMRARRHYGDGKLRLETTTSTVTLADDVETRSGDNSWVESRRNNAIHIKIFQTTRKNLRPKDDNKHHRKSKKKGW